MLKIYPRGFVGPILDNPDAKPSKKEVSIAGATFKVNYEESTKVTPDKEIQSLYQAFIENDSVIMRFDFRERVVKKAKRMFSLDGVVKDINVFISTQIEYGSFGRNHSEYLKRLLEYLIHGKMLLNQNTDARLLMGQDSIKVDKSVLKKSIDGVLKENNIRTVTDFVLAFVRRPGGYGVLLSTLWLMYGDFTGAHDE